MHACGQWDSQPVSLCMRQVGLAGGRVLWWLSQAAEACSPTHAVHVGEQGMANDTLSLSNASRLHARPPCLHRPTCRPRHTSLC